MSKKNEDNIERFFRKAVKQYDTPFMESDWQKMEKMLDEEAIERAAFLRAKHLRQAAFSLIILLFISSGIYLVISVRKQSGSPDKNKGMEQIQADASASDVVDDSKSENRSADQYSSNTNALHDNDNRQPSEDLKKTEQPLINPPTSLPDNHKRKERLTKAGNDPSHKNEIVPFAKEEAGVPMDTPGEPLQQELNSPMPETQNISIVLSNSPDIAEGSEFTDTERKEVFIADNRQTENIAEMENLQNANPVVEVSGKENGLVAGGENISRDHIAPVSQEAETSEPLAVPVDKEISDEEIIKEEIRRDDSDSSKGNREDLIPGRWNVALIVAPDFTSSVLGKYTAPGTAFGITAGYRLFKRFTITTGLIASTKKYEGFGSDYHPPKGYWLNKTNGIIPEEIAGTCEVYEVPVTLQYTLLQKKKTNVYIGAGVSSYVMASQQYVYTYEQPNPGAAKGWSTSKSFSYPFNIGHFSIAYERQVFSKVAIGLEPYVKIPFTGMGWSDVDLFSTGVFITLRYRFFKNQRVVAEQNAN